MPIDPHQIALRGGRAGRVPELGRQGRDGVKMLVQHDETLARFLSRVPAEVADSFDENQLLAIKRAAVEQAGREHGVDIRLTLFRRYYLVVLAGHERRHRARRRQERRRHPVLRAANVIFVNVVVLLLALAIAAGLYVATLAVDGGTGQDVSTWDSLLQQFRLMWRR